MPKPAKSTKTLIRTELEEDYSDENQAKCAGYVVETLPDPAGRPDYESERIRKCTQDHPHQTASLVKIYEDGSRSKTKIRKMFPELKPRIVRKAGEAKLVAVPEPKPMPSPEMSKEEVQERINELRRQAGEIKEDECPF